MKNKRHSAIIEIIETTEVFNQEGLLNLLKTNGFDVTQATVSRDIKTIDLIKIIGDDGKYKYSRRHEYTGKKNGVKFKSVFMEAVISVDYAINTVVIKCHVGMGNAACAALDTMDIGEVVGTLAGDDTIFVLLRTETLAKSYVEKINNIIRQ